VWSEAVENAPWWAGLIIAVGMFAMASVLWIGLWRARAAATASVTQARLRKRPLLPMAVVLIVGVVLGILISASVLGELDGRSVLRVFVIVIAAALACGFLFGVVFAIWTRLHQREE